MGYISGIYKWFNTSDNNGRDIQYPMSIFYVAYLHLKKDAALSNIKQASFKVF